MLYAWSRPFRRGVREVGEPLLALEVGEQAGLDSLRGQPEFGLGRASTAGAVERPAARAAAARRNAAVAHVGSAWRRRRPRTRSGLRAA
ncbi:MAG: hypothetical protein U0746_11200 [Gemmataceae bacterium]